jgi:hypothetical protein
MTTKLARRAPGGSGIQLRWTHGAKIAVGTAYSTSSRVWYTLDAGCVTEVYYPTIDTSQIRDLQFPFTDGETFFDHERRNFTSEIDCVQSIAFCWTAETLFKGDCRKRDKPKQCDRSAQQ